MKKRLHNWVNRRSEGKNEYQVLSKENSIKSSPDAPSVSISDGSYCHKDIFSEDANADDSKAGLRIVEISEIQQSKTTNQYNKRPVDIVPTTIKVSVADDRTRLLLTAPKVKASLGDSTRKTMFSDGPLRENVANKYDYDPKHEKWKVERQKIQAEIDLQLENINKKKSSKLNDQDLGDTVRNKLSYETVLVDEPDVDMQTLLLSDTIIAESIKASTDSESSDQGDELQNISDGSDSF